MARCRRTFYSGYALESIKEVQVFTNLFSAEFGDALASITSAVTKAGTNQWHGSALLFVRDDVLDALPPFATRTPPAGAQQVSVSLGGPIVKDRTHFWSSLERRRSRDRTIVVSPAAFDATAPDAQAFRWHHEPGGLTLPGSGTQYTNNVHTVLLTDALQSSDRTLNEEQGSQGSGARVDRPCVIAGDDELPAGH